MNHTKYVSIFSVWKPSKFGSTIALVISLALSGLKLKKITASFSDIVAIGLSPLHIKVGSTNSSKTSFWYESSIAVIADAALFPSPFTSAS